MSDTLGIRFDGPLPDLSAFVATAQAECDRAFPGAFRVILQPRSSTQEPCVIFYAGGDVFTVWFVGWSDDGLLGGPPPRCGDFGYWVLDVLMKRIAEATGGQAYSEGVGPLTQPVSLSFRPRSEMDSLRAFLVGLAKDLFKIFGGEVDDIPQTLIPWFTNPYKEVGDA